jgi:hypothetical protein
MILQPLDLREQQHRLAFPSMLIQRELLPKGDYTAPKSDHDCGKHAKFLAGLAIFENGQLRPLISPTLTPLSDHNTTESPITTFFKKST